MNADAVAALLNEGVEAFRLTREYVGEDLLPPLPGWSWFDWCEKAEAALAAAPLPSETPADGLDAAWREAEAALPEGYGLTLVRTPSRVHVTAYRLSARTEAELRQAEQFDVQGATPAEALRNLAALTQEPRSGADR